MLIMAGWGSEAKSDSCASETLSAFHSPPLPAKMAEQIEQNPCIDLECIIRQDFFFARRAFRCPQVFVRLLLMASRNESATTCSQLAVCEFFSSKNAATHCYEAICVRGRIMHPHMHMPDCILAPKMCSAADAGLSPIPCSTLRIAAPFFGAGREHAACADGQATRLPYVGLRPATGRRYNGSSGCPLLRGYEMNRAELQALAELRI